MQGPSSGACAGILGFLNIACESTSSAKALGIEKMSERCVQGQKERGLGSIGNGRPGHLAMPLMAKNDGLEFNHVPFKGGGRLMNTPLPTTFL